MSEPTNPSAPANPGPAVVDPAANLQQPQTQAAPVEPPAPPVQATFNQPPVEQPLADAANKPPEGKSAFPKVEDPGLNMCLDFLGKHGYNPESPSVQAALKGDFSFLAAELAANPKAQGYDKFLDLGKRAYDAEVAKAADATKAINSAVFDAVGGEQEWGKLQDWAVQNADKEELQAFDDIMALGPKHAGIAARFLSFLHGQTATVPAANPAEQATSVGGGDNSPLSAAGYKQEWQKLVAESNGNPHNHPRYKQIAARREAGQRQGI